MSKNSTKIGEEKNTEQNMEKNLEDSVKDVITQQLESGLIEKLIVKNLEDGINNALSNLFRSYGDVTRLIEDKIKSVMIPYLENYDYSEYIVKLDEVLRRVLNEATIDNREILENFANLITPVKEVKEGVIKLSDLFTLWTKYVEKKVDTDELEINYDDGEPTYEYVEGTISVEYTEGRDWLKQENAVIIMECDHDQSLNIAIPIYRYTDINMNWTINYKTTSDLSSLRNLNSFDVLLMNLKQTNVKVDVDIDHDFADIEPEERPEPSWD